MKLLILGGTKFVGRALVDYALERNHEVVLFNRGQTNPDLYPELEKIIGTRDGELDKIGHRKFDAVIDSSGYLPRIVQASANYLADKTDHYTFISSISVYKMDSDIHNRDESAPVGTLEDESIEEITNETYGPLKVLCEKAVENTYGARALIIRPGLIVGPHDPTNRFTYWPVRIEKGGDILAPQSPDVLSQFIDVRDLAAWTLHMIEARKSGCYNATGPDTRLTLGRVFETCKQVTGSDANFIWVSEPFLQEHEVGPWMEMPLWVPSEMNRAFHTTVVQKAIDSGLTFRPLEDTIRATLDWYHTLNGEREWPAGMKPEREKTLLDAWKSQA